MQDLFLVTLVVHDYDQAIAWFTQNLDFQLVEDTMRSETKRWVIVRPRNSNGCGLLLAKAAAPEQTAAVGNQMGGRVGFFLHTDDIHRDHTRMVANGVHFVRPISTEDFGMVTVFADLYGNLWDFIQPVS